MIKHTSNIFHLKSDAELSDKSDKEETPSPVKRPRSPPSARRQRHSSSEDEEMSEEEKQRKTVSFHFLSCCSALQDRFKVAFSILCLVES